MGVSKLLLKVLALAVCRRLLGRKLVASAETGILVVAAHHAVRHARRQRHQPCKRANSKITQEPGAQLPHDVASASCAALHGDGHAGTVLTSAPTADASGNPMHDDASGSPMQAAAGASTDINHAANNHEHPVDSSPLTIEQEHSASASSSTAHGPHGLIHAWAIVDQGLHQVNAFAHHMLAAVLLVKGLRLTSKLLRRGLGFGTSRGSGAKGVQALLVGPVTEDPEAEILLEAESAEGPLGHRPLDAFHQQQQEQQQTRRRRWLWWRKGGKRPREPGFGFPRLPLPLPPSRAHLATTQELGSMYCEWVALLHTVLHAQGLMPLPAGMDPDGKGLLRWLAAGGLMQARKEREGALALVRAVELIRASLAWRAAAPFLPPEDHQHQQHSRQQRHQHGSSIRHEHPQPSHPQQPPSHPQQPQQQRDSPAPCDGSSLQAWRDVMWWDGPDDQGAWWLCLDAQRAVQRCSTPAAAEACIAAIVTQVELGVLYLLGQPITAQGHHTRARRIPSSDACHLCVEPPPRHAAAPPASSSASSTAAAAAAGRPLAAASPPGSASNLAASAAAATAAAAARQQPLSCPRVLEQLLDQAAAAAGASSTIGAQPLRQKQQGGVFKDKLNLVVYSSGLNLGQAVRMAPVLRRCMATVLRHYPHRLGQAFVADVPLKARLVSGTLLSLLPSRTRKRVKLCRASEVPELRAGSMASLLAPDATAVSSAIGSSGAAAVTARS